MKFFPKTDDSMNSTIHAIHENYCPFHSFLPSHFMWINLIFILLHFSTLPCNVHVEQLVGRWCLNFSWILRKKKTKKFRIKVRGGNVQWRRENLLNFSSNSQLKNSLDLWRCHGRVYVPCTFCRFEDQKMHKLTPSTNFP